MIHERVSHFISQSPQNLTIIYCYYKLFISHSLLPNDPLFRTYSQNWTNNNWAMPWENPTHNIKGKRNQPHHEEIRFAICEQQRHRSACASTQSDQRLCFSLPREYNTSACYIQNFKTLASFWSWATRFESQLVGNPEDRFSRDEAQFIWIHSYWNKACTLVMENTLSMANSATHESSFFVF